MKSSKDTSGNSGTLLIDLMSELVQVVAAGQRLCELQEQMSKLQAQVTALQRLYSELLGKVSELNKYV